MVLVEAVLEHPVIEYATPLSYTIQVVKDDTEIVLGYVTKK